MLSYRSNIAPVRRFVPEVVDETPVAIPRDKFKARNFLREVLPDFCWQDAKEILEMASRMSPNVDEKCLSVALSQAFSEGLIERKISPYKFVGPYGVVYMYKRRSYGKP